MQHSAQDFDEEFPRALLNATGLAFARTRHVQDERHGIFRGEELSKPAPDLPRRVLFTQAHHEMRTHELLAEIPGLERSARQRISVRDDQRRMRIDDIAPCPSDLRELKRARDSRLLFDKHLKEHRRDITQYGSAIALHIQETLTAPAKQGTISVRRKF